MKRLSVIICLLIAFVLQGCGTTPSATTSSIPEQAKEETVQATPTPTPETPTPIIENSSDTNSLATSSLDYSTFTLDVYTNMLNLFPTMNAANHLSNMRKADGSQTKVFVLGTDKDSSKQIPKNSEVARFHCYDKNDTPTDGNDVAKIFGTISTNDAQYALGTVIAAICAVDHTISGTEAQDIGVDLFGRLADDPSSEKTYTINGIEYALDMNPADNTSVAFGITPANDSPSPSQTASTSNKAKVKTSTDDISQYRVYQSGTLTPAAETTGQKNALRMAKDYLAYSAFSYNSLVSQLEYEKFSHDDAVYAVDNCGANWNEHAAKCAKQYLDYSAFSRDSLIEQLEYEGFTHEQAVYGVEQNGY